MGNSDRPSNRRRSIIACPVTHFDSSLDTPLFGFIPGGSEERAKFLQSMQPYPRAGAPEDIAAMALFLASDEAEFITGTAIVVDGGMTAGNELARFEVLDDFAGPDRYLGPSFQWRR